MARTIAQIQTALLTQVAADSTLGPLLTSTSNAAIWRLIIYAVAVCQWTIEKLFDLHITEVTGILATMVPHTLQWYVTIAKEFQYGYALPLDSDTYTVTDTAAQVVTYAAAIEVAKGVRIKVATGSADALAALGGPQLTAFTAYMALVRDAGVRLYITSGNPDSLKLTYAIYYDALQLDATGARLDGSATTPIPDAINTFLQNLPFNGLFILDRLTQALEKVPGVVIAVNSAAQATYGALPYTDIRTLPAQQYQPDAGYLRIITPGTDLTLTFTPHDPV
ncbi:MAG: hypothetical protein H0X33_14420 [Taibaiella sp.]|nr:hypothetical protein [Taibaiella sp.]